MIKKTKDEDTLEELLEVHYLILIVWEIELQSI